MSAPTADREGTGVFSAGRAQIPQRTLRTDRWWVPTVLTNLGLAAFVIYATVRAFWGSAYWVADYHYLTPFYSPCVSKGCIPEASHFGQYLPDVWWLPYAAFSLPFLLLFRLTCYYYRKAYYRSVWQSPRDALWPNPIRHTPGDQAAARHAEPAPLLLLHRRHHLADQHLRRDPGLPLPTGFGFGLGNVILVVNVILLWTYTVSCHSCRHVTGGRLKHFSKHPVRYWMWTQVSKLNTRHMLFAWITLGTLVLTDFYVMLVASGTISDLRFIG